jgi:broad specificity phosphatase PhoE
MKENKLLADDSSCKLNINSSYDTVILLVRHGESLGNANREFLGHTDKDLSELGYRQAEITASYLSWLKIDSVYSSDLLRAHNTAKPHAELRGIDVYDSRNLREIYAGIWEGKKMKDIIAEYADFYYNVWRENFGECERQSVENFDGRECFV